MAQVLQCSTCENLRLIANLFHGADAYRERKNPGTTQRGPGFSAGY
jgi:hypothetical protein